MAPLPQKYIDARKEAQRFIGKLDELQDRADRDGHFARFMDITGGKETAAVKRASMDLTRALADLRR